jgi:hypothetical protein
LDPFEPWLIDSFVDAKGCINDKSGHIGDCYVSRKRAHQLTSMCPHI